MKLNADIIFDNLSRSVSMESYGQRKAELALNRPQFYCGESLEFKSDQLYIAFADHLPRVPIFGDGVVILCVGGNPSLPYMGGKCACFVLKDQTDLFSVFNSVQHIFDKYDAWEAGLQSIFDTSVSLDELVKLSFPIFENPIIIIGSDFRHLAHSDIIDTLDELATYRSDVSGNFNENKLSLSINKQGIDINTNHPFLITDNNIVHLCINLFDRHVYIGNMTIAFILRPYHESDLALGKYYAKIVERSVKKHSSRRGNILSGILQDLLNGLPLNLSKTHHLEKTDRDEQYICLSIIPGARSSHTVPKGYFCNILEDHFAGCIAFEYESIIIAFVELQRLDCDEKLFTDRLKKLLQNLHLKAGVSSVFSNLSMARLHYRQAKIAFEIGSVMHPDYCYYSFGDYALPYMMSNSIGEFPLELFFIKGIGRLLEHDSLSPTNYIHTLRTYLNNNMSITKTAEDLYLHRSSLLARLQRIENLLEMDLKNPDQRLHLLVILKILENHGANANQSDGRDQAHPIPGNIPGSEIVMKEIH